MIMTMSSIGLPALNGFIGELLILQGVFPVSKLWAAVAVSGIVLGAAYMLWLYQRTMFGKIENPANTGLQDLGLRELVTFLPLIGLAFWIGLYPAPFLHRIETSVGRVVARVRPEYAPFVRRGSDCPTPAQVAASGLPEGLVLAVPCAGGSDQTGGVPASQPQSAAEGSR
jgi:NADH-quinone oxidoreductase subunit M